MAAFSGLTLNKVGSGYSLRVAGAGLADGVSLAIQVTKKAQNLGAAASTAGSASAAPMAAIIPDVPGLWDGLGRKKRATGL